MKNSHIKVRQMIARADKIKNKDFFKNRVFNAHLEDIATNITKRYHGYRKVKVNVDWKTEESAPIAFTDNNLVYINAGSKLAKASDLKKAYKKVLGLFAHELGHILWTDFVATHSYINGLERGLWFPRNPRLVTYEMKVAEKEFWDLAKESPEHKKMLIDFVMNINNILEDGFIEEQIFRTYPGVLGLGLKELRDTHWEQIPELEQMIADEDDVDENINKHQLFTMFQLLLQYAKYGEVKSDNVPFDDEHLVLLGKVMPLVDEYMQSPPRERFALTTEVVLILFPVLKDCIEQYLAQQNITASSQGQSQGQQGQAGQNQNGQGQNGQGQGQMSSSQANALNQLIKNAVQGMSGNTTQAKGNTQACAGVKSNAQSNTQATQNRQKTQSQIPTSNPFGSSASGSDGNGSEDEENTNGVGSMSGGNDGSEEEVNGNAAGSGSDGPEDGEEETSFVSGEEPDEDDGDNGASGGSSGGEMPGLDGESGDGEVSPDGTDSQSTGKNFSGQGEKIAYGEGENEAPRGSGEVERNDEYEAQLDANLEAKLDALFEEMQENKAVKTLEGQRIRELNQFANDISYGDAHKGIDIRVNRVDEITEEMEETYKTVSKNFLPIAKNLARKYLQIADSARQGGRLDGLLMGRRFDAGAAYRKDGKVFMKNIMPQDMQPLAVALLIDESGSMSGTRSEVAMATAIILQNFCEQLNIPMAIYGHSTGSYECELYSYIEFDTYTKKDKYRLVDIGARGCNRDGAALRYTAERLMTRPEEAKVLILISDGQPNGWGYSGSKAEADLRGIQKEYTKKGVCFCAAAIGDDKDIIKGIYGDAFLDISNLNQLPVKLVKVLEKYLHTV